MLTSRADCFVYLGHVDDRRVLEADEVDLVVAVVIDGRRWDILNVGGQPDLGHCLKIE